MGHYSDSFEFDHIEKIKKSKQKYRNLLVEEINKIENVDKLKQLTLITKNIDKFNDIFEVLIKFKELR